MPSFADTLKSVIARRMVLGQDPLSLRPDVRRAILEDITFMVQFADERIRLLRGGGVYSSLWALWPGAQSPAPAQGEQSVQVAQDLLTLAPDFLGPVSARQFLQGLVPPDTWFEVLQKYGEQGTILASLSRLERLSYWLDAWYLLGTAWFEGLRQVADKEGALATSLMAPVTFLGLFGGVRDAFWFAVSQGEVPYNILTGQGDVEDLIRTMRSAAEKDLVHFADRLIDHLPESLKGRAQTIRDTFLEGARSALASIEARLLEAPPPKKTGFLDWAQNLALNVSFEGVHPVLRGKASELSSTLTSDEAARLEEALPDIQKVYNSYALLSYLTWLTNPHYLAESLHIPGTWVRPLRYLQYLFRPSLRQLGVQAQTEFLLDRNVTSLMLRAAKGQATADPLDTVSSSMLYTSFRLLSDLEGGTFDTFLAQAARQIGVEDKDVLEDYLGALVLKSMLDTVLDATLSGELEGVSPAELDKYLEDKYAQIRQHALDVLEEESRQLVLRTDVFDRVAIQYNPVVFRYEPLPVILRHLPSIQEEVTLSFYVPELRPLVQRVGNTFQNALVTLEKEAEIGGGRATLPDLSQELLPLVGKIDTAIRNFIGKDYKLPEISHALDSLGNLLTAFARYPLRAKPLGESLDEWFTGTLIPAVARDISMIATWPSIPPKPVSEEATLGETLVESYPVWKARARMRGVVNLAASALLDALQGLSIQGIVPFQARLLESPGQRVLGMLVLEHGLQPLKTAAFSSPDLLTVLTDPALETEVLRLIVRELGSDPEVQAFVEEMNKAAIQGSTVPPEVWAQAEAWAQGKRDTLYRTTLQVVTDAARAWDALGVTSPETLGVNETFLYYSLPEEDRQKLHTSFEAVVQTLGDGDYHAGLRKLAENAARWVEAKNPTLDKRWHTVALSTSSLPLVEAAALEVFTRFFGPSVLAAGELSSKLLPNATSRVLSTVAWSTAALLEKPMLAMAGYAPFPEISWSLRYPSQESPELLLGELSSPQATQGLSRINAYLKTGESAPYFLLPDAEVTLRDLELKLSKIWLEASHYALGLIPSDLSLASAILAWRDCAEFLDVVITSEIAPYLLSNAAVLDEVPLGQGQKREAVNAVADEALAYTVGKLTRYLSERLQARAYSRLLSQDDVEALSVLTKWSPWELKAYLFGRRQVISSWQAELSARLADPEFAKNLASSLLSDRALTSLLEYRIQARAVKGMLEPKTEPEYLKAWLAEELQDPSSELHQAVCDATNIGQFYDKILAGLAYEARPTTEVFDLTHVAYAAFALTNYVKRTPIYVPGVFEAKFAGKGELKSPEELATLLENSAQALRALSQDRESFPELALRGFTLLRPTFGLLWELPGLGLPAPTELLPWFTRYRYVKWQSALQGMAEDMERAAQGLRQNLIDPSDVQNLFGLPQYGPEEIAAITAVWGLFSSERSPTEALGLSKIVPLFAEEKGVQDMLKLLTLSSSEYRLSLVDLGLEHVFHDGLAKLLEGLGPLRPQEALSESEIQELRSACENTIGKSPLLDLALFYGLPPTSLIQAGIEKFLSAARPYLAMKYWARLSAAFGPEEALSPTELLERYSDYIPESFDAPGIITLLEKGKLKISPEDVAAARQDAYDVAAKLALMSAPVLTLGTVEGKEASLKLAEALKEKSEGPWLAVALASRIRGSSASSLEALATKEVFGPNFLLATELFTVGFNQALAQPPTSTFGKSALSLATMPDEELLSFILRTYPALTSPLLATLNAMKPVDQTGLSWESLLRAQAFGPEELAQGILSAWKKEASFLLTNLRDKLADLSAKVREVEVISGPEALDRFADPVAFGEILSSALQSVQLDQFGLVITPPTELQALGTLWPLTGELLAPEISATAEKTLHVDPRKWEAILAQGRPWVLDEVPLARARAENLLERPLGEEINKDPLSVFLGSLSRLEPTKRAQAARTLAESGLLAPEEADLLSQGDFQAFEEVARNNELFLERLSGFLGQAKKFVTTLHNNVIKSMVNSAIAQGQELSADDIASRLLELHDQLFAEFIWRNLARGFSPGPLQTRGWDVKPETWGIWTFQEAEEDQPIEDPLAKAYVDLNLRITWDLLKNQWVNAMFTKGEPLKIGRRTIPLMETGPIYNLSWGLFSTTPGREMFQRMASAKARKAADETLAELKQKYKDGLVPVVELVTALERKTRELYPELVRLAEWIKAGWPVLEDVLGQAQDVPPEIATTALQESLKAQAAGALASGKDPWDVVWVDYLVNHHVFSGQGWGALGVSPPAEDVGQALAQTGLVVGLESWLYWLYQLGEQLWEVGKYATAFAPPTEARAGRTSFWEEFQKSLGEFYAGTISRNLPFNMAPFREELCQNATENRALVARAAQIIGDPALLDYLDIGVWLSRVQPQGLADEPLRSELAKSWLELWNSGLAKKSTYWERLFLLWDKIYRYGQGPITKEVLEANRALAQYLSEKVPVATGEILNWTRLENIWRTEVEPLLFNPRTDTDKQNLLYYWKAYVWPAAQWVRDYLGPHAPQGVWLLRSAEIQWKLQDLIPREGAQETTGIRKAWHWLIENIPIAFKAFWGKTSGVPMLDREFLKLVDLQQVPVVIKDEGED